MCCLRTAYAGWYVRFSLILNDFFIPFFRWRGLRITSCLNFTRDWHCVWDCNSYHFENGLCIFMKLTKVIPYAHVFFCKPTPQLISIFHSCGSIHYIVVQLPPPPRGEVQKGQNLLNCMLIVQSRMSIWELGMGWGLLNTRSLRTSNCLRLANYTQVTESN